MNIIKNMKEKKRQRNIMLSKMSLEERIRYTASRDMCVGIIIMGISFILLGLCMLAFYFHIWYSICL